MVPNNGTSAQRWQPQRYQGLLNQGLLTFRP